MTAYLTGNVNSGVGEALAQLWGKLPPFEVAMIRSLDSQRNALEIASVLGRFGIHVVTPGVPQVDRESLMKATNIEGLFVHYDEIWLLSEAQPRLEWSKNWILTGDALRLDSSTPAWIPEAMSRTGCTLALGDGDGLNHVTSDSEFHRALIAAYA